MNQLAYSTTFNDKGYAKLEVPMSQAQPVFANVKNYGRMFLSPGDTLYVAFDGAWQDHFEKAIWMGKYAQFNYDINKYDVKYWGMAEFTRESNTLLNKPSDKYKEARAALTNKINTSDKEYFKATTCSPGFIQLVAICNQVEEWDDFMRYRWESIRFRRSTVQFPSEYFNFLKEIDYSNRKYWYSENMAWFLSEIKNWLSSANETEKVAPPINEIIEKILSSNTEIPDSTKKSMQVCLGHRNTKLSNKLISEITKDLSISFKDKIDSVYNALVNKKDFDLIDFYRKNQKIYNPEEFEIIANWMNSSKDLYTKDVLSYVNNYLNKYLAEERKQRSFNFDLLNASEDTKKIFTIMVSLNEFRSTLEKMNEKEIRDGYAELQKLDIPPTVLETVHQKYEETLAIIAQPMPGDVNLETVAPGSGDEFMAKLAQKHAGKVVYIDFWAPWCGPCKGEFPYAPQLKKKFEGKDVVFVYICCSGEKNAWENCIKQYKIIGDHYYFEEKTFDDKLGKKYSINSIPRYMIMDKKGNIVDFASSRPSNIEETSRRLSSYLK